jgi:hypothetical protein
VPTPPSSPVAFLALLLPMLPMADAMPMPVTLQQAPIGDSPREQAASAHAAAHAAAVQGDLARADALYSLTTRLYVDVYGSDQHPALAGLWAERQEVAAAQRDHSLVSSR